jgi:hypothetical protein
LSPGARVHHEDPIEETVYRPAHDVGVAWLTTAQTSRLNKGIARAFRGTYGARMQLSKVVRAIAAEMLAEGVAPAWIAEVVERCVMDNPVGLANDRRDLLTGAFRSESILALTRECVAEVTLAGAPAPRLAHAP